MTDQIILKDLEKNLILKRNVRFCLHNFLFCWTFTFNLISDGYLDVLKPKKSYTKKLDCTQCGTFTIFKYTTQPGSRAKNFAAFKCGKCKKLNANNAKKMRKIAIRNVVLDNNLETVIEVDQKAASEIEGQKRNRKKINFDEKCKKNQ